MIYPRRRQLQNMADAALAAAERLSQDKDEATAYQSAMDSIAGNGGRVEWYSTLTTANPITTNVGSGLNLIKGIQITNACDVRVALQWSDMGTYFTQFFGRQTLDVGAKGAPGCNRAEGLCSSPSNVSATSSTRIRSPPPSTGDPSTIYCDQCDTRLPLSSQGNYDAYDFLKPQVSDVITAWPTGTLLYQPPSPHANLAAGAAGREYTILGEGVAPNVGTTTWRLVNLDIRHISSSPKEYYNNVAPGTGTNTLKDLGETICGAGIAATSLPLATRGG
jgi:hypothetical protein